MLFSLLSCTNLHEAQRTIAEADSLRSVGVAFDDSLRLDSAYAVLGTWWNRTVRPDDYARACYYCGRLHRNRGNQVEAMKCFINGTHAGRLAGLFTLPWFSDYAVLGRTYTNIGMMCHTIDEFQLAYDMYEKSSEQFMKANDTIAYYYALYDMSFELSEMCMYDETMAVLNKIENECEDENVLLYPWVTRTNLYENIGEYDSVIYAVNKLEVLNNQSSYGYVKKAQAYWHLEQYDSAVYYAKQVMQHPYATSQDKCNMLYILTYNDTTINEEEIKRRSEERGDIDRYIIDPLEQQLSQAVQILRQDIDRKPKTLHLILLLISVCFVIVVSWFAKIRIRRQHTRAIDDIAAKQQQLVSQTIQEQQKQELLQQKNNDIRQQYDDCRKQMLQELENNLQKLHDCKDWKSILSWNDDSKSHAKIDLYFNNFATRLSNNYNLNIVDIKYCTMSLLNFDNRYISENLPYSYSGIKTLKKRIANKLFILPQDMSVFLADFALLTEDIGLQAKL